MSNEYQFPFGEYVHPVVQEDRTPKKVFVLGVYASAVHAKWVAKNGKIACKALAVASEPRIFWDGNEKEAEEIIKKIRVPSEMGHLELPDKDLNGPSAKALDEKILAPLGFDRKDAWLCDLLPESRLNRGQQSAISKKYKPFLKKLANEGLNEVTVPNKTEKFCDNERVEEITKELLESQADLLILLGDKPIQQYLHIVEKESYKRLDDYKKNIGYGRCTDVEIGGKMIKVLPLAHPRQIARLGRSSQKWYAIHQKWLAERNNK
ncbi:hypothetical protein [Anaerovibrio sp. RM50]|uniref:hypothetical protein n=1 Tax=Anaerovibrio sp. RM50 TaxID=1200557 RepID=UPI000907ABAB|nr:hypothetical protein [Anaerovibrio sp. RM50]